MNENVIRIVLMLVIPFVILAQNADSSRVKINKDFMYDLGIKIEPARESAPLKGIGVANPSLVHVQNQIDSLSLAFSQFFDKTKIQMQTLRRIVDSLEVENQRLKHQVFRSPYAALGNPRVIYSKKEGERFFQKGNNAYLAKNYPIAVDYFVKCIDSDLPGAQIGDAYFWIGNCYIHLKDEYLALEYLKKVMEYPLCENLDDALFLSAVTYRKIGNKEMATTFLKRLLRRFPEGQMAKLADLELKRLGTMD
ncbi:MAG: tetratricopeptide repeat protein [Candidatus Marinimicrobia bacterium]|nr:tetratricopeptide repeat protein [Candidatus Neomarinimicrobiota bacterium]